MVGKTANSPCSNTSEMQAERKKNETSINLLFTAEINTTL